MKLTRTLLGYLNRVFNKDPGNFIAIAFIYAGDAMTWAVADGVLTVAVTGGVGAGFSVALDNYTLESLALYISGLTGFTVNFVSPGALGNLSAMVLLDSSGSMASGKSRIFGYTSILFSYLETSSAALNTAEVDLVQALQQISVRDGSGNASAAGYWLDEIGSYYGVPRLPAEVDAVYGPRIIAEVLRAKGNNVALESAIKYYTGQQTTVVDVAVPAFSVPLYDATYFYNGVREHNSVGTFQYNLFDVDAGYDLINGGDIATFKATVEAVIGRLRDAGTHLRALSLGGSQLQDTLTAPTDSYTPSALTMPFTDALTAPDDALAVIPITVAGFSDTLTAGDDSVDSLEVTYEMCHGGLRHYNGAVAHLGGYVGDGYLSGIGDVYTRSIRTMIDDAGAILVTDDGSILVCPA
jgi:hypothetical protein